MPKREMMYRLFYTATKGPYEGQTTAQDFDNYQEMMHFIMELTTDQYNRIKWVEL